MQVQADRVRILKQAKEKSGSVIYWMSRDQRVRDNWALLFAIKKAKESHSKVLVVFTLANEFLGATLQQYDFMLNGLKEVETELQKLNIPFSMIIGNPVENLPEFIKNQKAAILVTDFDPLRIKRKWKEEVAAKIQIPFYEVDAHNIIPCWVASQKREFGAYTLRPKVKRLIHEYLTDFPSPEKLSQENYLNEPIPWNEVFRNLKIDRNVKPVDWIQPGEENAKEFLKQFIEKKLNHYNEKRNDPNSGFISDLSPFLHFGQISAQRIALEISSHNITPDVNTAAFLEELIVRRELSDNFCYYNPHYDSFEGFPDWAKKTLNEHRKDEREYIYSLEEFEIAKTHDQLWNAAQMEMVNTGKMHGYMRMYWAKKILEWTKSPEEALQFAIYLNDKYELDGRDPKGYTGCAWSIGGVHDRAWNERPVFGKIRYMNANGAKRKFNTGKYINRNR